MHRVALILAFFIVLSHAISTTQKIKKEQKNLKSTSNLEKKLARKIDSLADGILRGEKTLQQTDTQIISLEAQIKELLATSKEKAQTLAKLSKTNENLISTKKELEEKIIKIIADKFSFFLITDKGYQDSKESIIADEALQKIDAILKNDFQTLSKQYEITNNTISKHNSQIKDIKKSLSGLQAKQESLKKLRRSRESNVVALKKQKAKYKTKLNRLLNQKKELQRTLAKLKIIRSQEIKDQRAQKAQSKQTNRTVSTGGKVSVRQIGSSYQQGRVKRYKGKKTIAPLDSFTIKQKFGNYIDPIYKIKIFNESVVLRSKRQNSKVKNILNGKVIFAKDTAMLDKVVIVENSLGIHTIYAHMNKIAPTIKVGKKIKRGYIIGRVVSDLTFEVTQKNYHINPLELIRY